VARLLATTPHGLKLCVISVAIDGKEYIALRKTERIARPFTILPLWQLVPDLDIILSDE